eukprot:4238604-Amphidinium_carterae.1
MRKNIDETVLEMSTSKVKVTEASLSKMMGDLHRDRVGLYLWHSDSCKEATGESAVPRPER